MVRGTDFQRAQWELWNPTDSRDSLPETWHISRQNKVSAEIRYLRLRCGLEQLEMCSRRRAIRREQKHLLTHHHVNTACHFACNTCHSGQAPAAAYPARTWNKCVLISDATLPGLSWCFFLQHLNYLNGRGIISPKESRSWKQKYKLNFSSFLYLAWKKMQICKLTSIYSYKSLSAICCLRLFFLIFLTHSIYFSL